PHPSRSTSDISRKAASFHSLMTSIPSTPPEPTNPAQTAGIPNPDSIPNPVSVPNPVGMADPATTRSRRTPVVRKARNPREYWLIDSTIIFGGCAWRYGYIEIGKNVTPLVPNVLPTATTITLHGSISVSHDASGDVVGYAAAGSNTGYGGPIEVLVGVDAAGN